MTTTLVRRFRVRTARKEIGLSVRLQFLCDVKRRFVLNERGRSLVCFNIFVNHNIITNPLYMSQYQADRGVIG